MKRKPSHPLNVLTVLTLSAVSLAAWGCSKSDRDTASDKVADAYHDTKAAVADSWDSVKDYTFEKSSDFKARAEAVSSDLDAKIAKLQSSFAAEKASARRRWRR